MDDTLPSFESVENCPLFSDTDVRRLTRALEVDPAVVDAEKACKSGDTERAISCIE